MIRVIVEGLSLGLSTGVYCLGTCLIFFMPYLVVEGKQKIFENADKIVLFMLGRLIAYMLFAVLIGAIGAANRDIFTVRFSNYCLVVVSLVMLVYAFTNKFADAALCKTLLQRFGLMRIPFFLGLFSGLNPCLPFLVGAARIVTLHSISAGVVLFAAFFVGTSLYMVPLVFVSYLNRIERVKPIALMVALLSSVWFLFVGIAGALGK